MPPTEGTGAQGHFVMGLLDFATADRSERKMFATIPPR